MSFKRIVQPNSQMMTGQPKSPVIISSVHADESHVKNRSPQHISLYLVNRSSGWNPLRTEGDFRGASDDFRSRENLIQY